MQSNKIKKLAEKIVKNDKELFDQLIEYEKNQKIQTKLRLNFTIDKATANRFRKYCRERGYNMSAKVEQAINKIIQEK